LSVHFALPSLGIACLVDAGLALACNEDGMACERICEDKSRIKAAKQTNLRTLRIEKSSRLILSWFRKSDREQAAGEPLLPSTYVAVLDLVFFSA